MDQRSSARTSTRLGLDIRFIVTNLDHGSPEWLYESLYCVPALEEQALWTAAVVGAKPEARITLTFPALNSSAAVAFLVAGARKHAMLQRLRARDRELPASRVEPSGALYILADEAAASGRAQP
jgi:6-phosphogluconolactonase/glucosamine-6-phosphate isomerase/deaminase